MTVRIVVDRMKCLGNEVCIGVAPDLFELDDDLVSTAKVEALADDDQIGLAREAARLCPVQAISVFEVSQPSSGR